MWSDILHMCIEESKQKCFISCCYIVKGMTVCLQTAILAPLSSPVESRERTAISDRLGV